MLLQDYSKECVAHVQKYLMKHEVPPNLFEVCLKFMFYLSAVTEKLQSNCQSAAKLQLRYRFCAVGITEPKLQTDCAVGLLAVVFIYLLKL